MKVYLKVKGAFNPITRALINVDKEMVINIDREN